MAVDLARVRLATQRVLRDFLASCEGGSAVSRVVASMRSAFAAIMPRPETMGRLADASMQLATEVMRTRREAAEREELERLRADAAAARAKQRRRKQRDKANAEDKSDSESSATEEEEEAAKAASAHRDTATAVAALAAVGMVASATYAYKEAVHEKQALADVAVAREVCFFFFCMSTVFI